MDTFLQLQTAVQNDLTVDSTSALYSPTTIKSALNRAYRKAGSLFRWPPLEDAKKTSTVAGQDYYDAPETWRPDSIWKLKVDGVRYGERPDGSPLSYDDYLIFKEDEPDSIDKKWSIQWLRYFISPTPTTNGNNNICIWGQKNVETLVNDSDITIFSYSMPEGNEAIVLEAVAILKAKGNEETSTQFKSAEAKQILATAWSKIRQEQPRNEKLQPMFEVTDMFAQRGGNKDTNIGDFT